MVALVSRFPTDKKGTEQGNDGEYEFHCASTLVIELSMPNVASMYDAAPMMNMAAPLHTADCAANSSSSLDRFSGVVFSMR